MAGFCEHGDEPLGFVKQLFDQVNCCWSRKIVYYAVS